MFQSIKKVDRFIAINTALDKVHNNFKYSLVMYILGQL